MPQLLKNNVSGALANELSAVATSMTLVDASSFPDPGSDYFLCTLAGLDSNGREDKWEIVRVTAKASNTLTITRGQEGTTNRLWPAASAVQMRLTAGSVATPDALDAKQPLDADLTAIAALTGTAGLLKKTAANTWVLDTTAYQTAQPVTGIVKSSGTTRSAAVAGTDYVAPGGALGTPSSGNLSNCTADGTSPVGFRNIPQNSKSANYTCVLADAGEHILHPSADTTARTFTIPANSVVAFPIGTAITFINQNGAGNVTIAISLDTMRLAGAGTTGSRTLAANGVATAVKVAATEWIISGVGLT